MCRAACAPATYRRRLPPGRPPGARARSRAGINATFARSYHDVRYPPHLDCRRRALLLIAGATAIAFRWAPATRAALPKAAATVPVGVASVVARSVPVRLRAIGNVEPFTTVAVKARIDGQIVAVHFREGQEVRKGDTLFEIDRAPARGAAPAGAGERSSRIARCSTTRTSRKSGTRTCSTRSSSRRTPTRRSARTPRPRRPQVSADSAAIRSAELSLDYCTIRSPITGYTGKIQIQEGNLVKANDTSPLVVLNQVVPINASFSVPEQSLAAVRKYQADGELQVTAAGAELRARPGRRASSRSSTTRPTRRRGRSSSKPSSPNIDKALWPGQFVDVALTLTHQDDAIVVPPGAVQNGPNGQYVFVVKPDSTVELRTVKVAATRAMSPSSAPASSRR